MAADHPMVATSLFSLGEAMRIDGDLAGAERLQRRVLEVRRQQLPSGHHAILQTVVELAEILLATGDVAAAAPLCKEAIEAAEPMAAHAPEILAQALYCQGQADIATGHRARAIPRLERALALAKASSDPFNVGFKPYQIAWIQFLLATVQRGSPIAAVRASRDVLARRPLHHRYELAQIDDWLRRHAR